MEQPQGLTIHEETETMQTFQARFLIPPAAEVTAADLQSSDFRRRRDLPEVVAETAQAAAEQASQWYGLCARCAS